MTGILHFYSSIKKTFSDAASFFISSVHRTSSTKIRWKMNERMHTYVHICTCMQKRFKIKFLADIEKCWGLFLILTQGTNFEPQGVNLASKAIGVKLSPGACETLCSPLCSSKH
jgi:hypothetical protein